MPLALLALALLALVLLVTVVLNAFRVHRRRRPRLRPPRTRDGVAVLDPGRERRAEQRARELLRSCVNEEEWAMYRELGFIRVFGRGGARLRGGGGAPPEDRRYAYLVYPHKPIVAYEPATRRLLSEYCVDFPDLGDAVTGYRLPDSDDVLAKWMALTGDERRLLRDANMHLPGRQLDPGRVRRDLWRLEEWEHRRRRWVEAPRG